MENGNVGLFIMTESKVHLLQIGNYDVCIKKELDIEDFLYEVLSNDPTLTDYDFNILWVR